jgi:cytochrome c-type biogenesis protein CcsB
MAKSYLIFVIVYSVFSISGLLYIWNLIKSRQSLSKIPLWIAAFGVVLQTGGLIFRWVEANHVPWANMYESLLLLSYVIALEFVVVELIRPTRSLGVVVIPLSWFVLGYALNVPPVQQFISGCNWVFHSVGSRMFFPVPNTAVENMMPALQSYWIKIHVPTVFFSYAAFALAFGTGVLYMFQYMRRGKNNSNSQISRLDDMETLDKQTYWLISIGTVLLGIGIIMGSLWGYEAWGTYWGWDPKETWSLIVFLIYIVYLHARLIAGWRGQKTAWFAIIGFIAVIMCYYGVNVIFPFFSPQGLHSYGAPDSVPR